MSLHILAVVMLAGSSVPIWDLSDAGAASATLTAQALSPLAAVVGTALLVPGAVSPPQLAAAVLVVAGVTWALRDAFVRLGRRASVVRIVVAAIGVGMLTVLTRLLADEGVGVVETYVTRTGLGAALMLIAIPPRGLPLSAAPRLLARAITLTAYFVLMIVADQDGSPVVVQTMVSVAPLLTLACESLRSRRSPRSRR